MESAHARWLYKDVVDTSRHEVLKSQPIPDAPGSISKLLNMVECDEQELVEVLVTKYELEDETISAIIPDRDELVKQIWTMFFRDKSEATKILQGSDERW